MCSQRHASAQSKAITTPTKENMHGARGRETEIEQNVADMLGLGVIFFSLFFFLNKQTTASKLTLNLHGSQQYMYTEEGEWVCSEADWVCHFWLSNLEEII